jgi:hypothetical protein
MGRDSYHCKIEPLGGARRLGTIDCADLFDGTELLVTIALVGPAALQRPRRRSERLARASGMPELGRQMIQRRHERCGQLSRLSYDGGSELRESFACMRVSTQAREARGRAVGCAGSGRQSAKVFVCSYPR